MNKLFDILLKLAAIILLVIAAMTTQPYNYFVLLRWFMFLSSSYFAYRSKDLVGIYRIRFGVIFLSALAVLFNPFFPFRFTKEVWHIIDLSVAALFILFGSLNHDWRNFKGGLSKTRKIVFDLIQSCVLGTLALIIAIAFWQGMLEINPYHEFLLITKATTVKGFITHSEEEEDDVESETQGSRRSFIIYYDYTFTTKKGEIIKDHASDRSPKSGYLQEANATPLPIDVEYISSDPQIHRIKDMTGQANTLFDFLWRRIGLGIILLLVFCGIGFEIIKNGIKVYLTERKKITAKLEIE
ncbi:MAG: hypothetical protein NTX03_03305 [Bacteroidetes bacterium]|nr:hypothetical protein [Bacteroidota bacterium]